MCAVGGFVAAGGRKPSPTPTPLVTGQEGSDDDYYDDIADVNKFIGAPQGAAPETRLIDRVADVLTVGVIVLLDEPDGIVQPVQDFFTELGKLRASRDRLQSELKELRRQVTCLRAVGDASQGQFDELRGVARTLVPEAAE